MTRIVADLPRRIAAYAIDVGLLLIVLAVVFGVVFAVGGLDAVSNSASLIAIATVVWMLVLALMQARGASVGMSIFALRVDDDTTGEPLGFGRAVLRVVVWVLLCMVVVGYVTVFFDRSGRRQGWHDRLARAVVTGRGERPKVMVDLPARDLHAAEWFAAMSTPTTITEIPSLDTDSPQHDTTTRAAGGGPALRAAAPVLTATVVWDDGTATVVTKRTVFGRNPVPTRATAAVAVADSTMSLSKTHFEVAPTETGVVIIDLNSTNGVSVRRDGVTSQLIPGEALVVRSGDIVEIGPRRARVEVGA